ncbi:hypothetical protein DL89DRAFT_265138, partial [Linderina pennispora]
MLCTLDFKYSFNVQLCAVHRIKSFVKYLEWATADNLRLRSRNGGNDENDDSRESDRGVHFGFLER